MATLVNTSFGRDPKAEPARPEQFDPWEATDAQRRRSRGDAPGTEEIHAPIEVLKWAWVDNQPAR